MGCVSEVIFLEVRGFKILTMMYEYESKLYLLENIFSEGEEGQYSIVKLKEIL